jgi:hypothetical protein
VCALLALVNTSLEQVQSDTISNATPHAQSRKKAVNWRMYLAGFILVLIHCEAKQLCGDVFCVYCRRHESKSTDEFWCSNAGPKRPI